MAAKKKMHKMPGGKMMSGAKHEKTEGKKERMKLIKHKRLIMLDLLM